MIDPAHTARLIEGADAQGLAALLATVTPTRLGPTARGWVLGANLELRLMGVSMIAEDLARGLNPPQGSALGEAALAVGRAHLPDPTCNPGNIAECVAHAAHVLAMGHAQVGRHRRESNKNRAISLLFGTARTYDQR